MTVQIANESHGITSQDRKVTETPVDLVCGLFPQTVFFFFIGQRRIRGMVSCFDIGKCLVSAATKCFEQVKRKQIETYWHVAFLPHRQDTQSFPLEANTVNVFYKITILFFR